MTQHTPGPWKIFNAWEHKGVIAFSRIGNDEKSVIRSENTQTDIYATNEADLHLIAAAPELLEACEKIIKYDEAPASGVVDHNAIYENAIRLARAAIAKAKGE